MGMTVVRTMADELADVERALQSARKELRNWAAHCDRMLTNPDDAAAIAMQARRSAKIVDAALDEAHVHTIAAGLLDEDRATSDR